jgi:hypothetical protein
MKKRLESLEMGLSNEEIKNRGGISSFVRCVNRDIGSDATQHVESFPQKGFSSRFSFLVVISSRK